MKVLEHPLLADENIDPELVDTILDRLVHNAHRIELTGSSMRKKRSNLTKETKSGN